VARTTCFRKLREKKLLNLLLKHCIYLNGIDADCKLFKSSETSSKKDL